MREGTPAKGRSGRSVGRRRGGGAGTAPAGGGGAGWLGAHVVTDAAHEVAEVVHVAAGQGVEQQVADDADVAGQEAAEAVQAGVGDGDQDGPLVVGAGPGTRWSGSCRSPRPARPPSMSPPKEPGRGVRAVEVFTRSDGRAPRVRLHRRRHRRRRPRPGPRVTVTHTTERPPKGAGGVRERPLPKRIANSTGSGRDAARDGQPVSSSTGTPGGWKPITWP